MKAEWRDVGDSAHYLFAGDDFLGIVRRVGEGYWGQRWPATGWGVTESTRESAQHFVTIVARDAMQAKVDALEELLDRDEEGTT